MKYVAYMKQKGGGCDYTIGCGLQLIFLKSENIEDAKEEAKRLLDYYGSSRGSEIELEKYLVMEISKTHDFLNEFYDEIENKQKAYKEKKIREKELAELKRLNDKYVK